MKRFYRNGTLLFHNDRGMATDYRQEYSITSSKNSKKESLYLNATLQHTRRMYQLNTISNRALKTQQNLSGSNTDWQFNFNYNKKLGPGTLWSNTLGYFSQKMDEQLISNPDFLFWLFPEDLTLYQLLSSGDIQLRYLNIKSNLLINKGRISHEFTGLFTSEGRTFLSALNAKKDTGKTSFFQNESHLSFPGFTFRYTGNYRLSPNSKITFSLSNDPTMLHYSSASKQIKKTVFFYDYSMGLSTKNRNSSVGITAGIKRQPENHHLFFADYIQSNFHRLLSGRIDTFGTKSSYLRANYSLFSLKLGWIAFLSLNVSRDQNKYIRSIETNGIGTTNAYIHFPNSTNQLFFFFNTQKTLGKWPFALNSNMMYNAQSHYYRFNGNITPSTLRLLNTTLGTKSLFESIINFDYHFSWLHSRNKTKFSEPRSATSNTMIHRVNIYLTPPHLFNTTITFNSLATNKGSFHGHFLDIKLNKKLLKDKLIIEFNLRNIFDKQFLRNTVIGSNYTRENWLEIRGREFFFTFRYEFR